jgi:hypothetical protein
MFTDWSYSSRAPTQFVRSECNSCSVAFTVILNDVENENDRFVEVNSDFGSPNPVLTTNTESFGLQQIIVL